MQDCTSLLGFLIGHVVFSEPNTRRTLCLGEIAGGTTCALMSAKRRPLGALRSPARSFNDDPLINNPDDQEKMLTITQKKIARNKQTEAEEVQTYGYCVVAIVAHWLIYIIYIVDNI